MSGSTPVVTMASLQATLGSAKAMLNAAMQGSAVTAAQAAVSSAQGSLMTYLTTTAGLSTPAATQIVAILTANS